MNEFMQMLKDKGVIDRFVERNNMSIAETRNKNGVPDWTPPKEGVKLAASLGLHFELTDEEIAEAFMKFAFDYAMDAVTEELCKIAMEGK
jgi:hypothetical protein